MKRLIVAITLLALLAAGCSAPTPTPPPPTPTPAPTATPQPQLAPGEVTFKTEDGLTLYGTTYGPGSGETAVLLSNMWGLTENNWRPFVRQLAEQGYTVMTFDYRGYAKSEGQRNIGKTVADERAALAFLREHGFKRIISMGGSIGGFAAARNAHEPGVVGLVLLGAPAVQAQAGSLGADDFEGVSYPKLFVESERDPYVGGAAAALYKLAEEPKQLKVFPGSEHGTELIFGEHKAEVQTLLLEFLKAVE